MWKVFGVFPKRCRDVAFGCCEVLANQSLGDVFKRTLFGRRRWRMPVLLYQFENSNQSNGGSLRGTTEIHMNYG